MGPAPGGSRRPKNGRLCHEGEGARGGRPLPEGANGAFTPAIGFSGTERETVCRYQLRIKIVLFNNGDIGSATTPADPLHTMKSYALIYGARHDKVMEAFGGNGFFIEEPKDLKRALEEASARSSTSVSSRRRPASRGSSAATADRLTVLILQSLRGCSGPSRRARTLGDPPTPRRAS